MKTTSNELKPASWSTKDTVIALLIYTIIVAGTYSAVFSYVAFLLSAVAVVKMSEKDAVCYMMMIMPFANIFKSSPNAQSFFTYLILFYAFWYFFTRKCINKLFLTAFCIFVLFLFGQMFISLDTFRTIKFIVNILIIYIAVTSEAIKDSEKVGISYVVGMAVSSLVAAFKIVPNLSDYIGIKEAFVEYKHISRFTGMYGDPNYYAINIIISLCLIVILSHNKKLATIPTVCLTTLMVVFVGMTISKSAFLMMILPLVLLLYSQTGKKNYVIVLCVVAVIIMFSMLIVFGKIHVFDNVLYRFDEAEDMASLTTGRSELWGNYIGFLLDNPFALLFGLGFGANLLDGTAAHNTYIDLLYYFGIFGTMLFIWVFHEMININKRKAKGNLFNYSIWICIAIMYFFLSELFYFDWAFHVILAILVLDMDIKRGKETEK